MKIFAGKNVSKSEKISMNFSSVFRTNILHNERKGQSVTDPNHSELTFFRCYFWTIIPHFYWKYQKNEMLFVEYFVLLSRLFRVNFPIIISVFLMKSTPFVSSGIFNTKYFLMRSFLILGKMKLY